MPPKTLRQALAAAEIDTLVAHPYHRRVQPNSALRWSLTKRLAFRFLFSYFVLFSSVVTFFGSGDTVFHWRLLLLCLALAGAATLVWSALDRKRVEHERLHQWLRL